jgi:DNA polymerase-3 subunit delta'
VVVIEDADRLTESSANALLKVIEEPGARTVWLLCAPTLTDVIPTIRSRCRHLSLRTPSISAVAKLLIERDGIDPKMAEFAASAAQGHIGRAKYLATNENARKIREKILNIPFMVTNLASAYEAANTLLELAKEQALTETETRDEEELTKLKESYGTTGSRLATGGSRAVKELERNQKIRQTRQSRDFIENCTIEYLYESIKVIKNEVLNPNNKTYNATKPISSANCLQETHNLIERNSNIQLTLESLFLQYVINKN